MRRGVAVGLVAAALLAALPSTLVLARNTGSGSGPIPMAISINGIEDSCSAMYYGDPPPGYSDVFLGTGQPGSANVIINVNSHGAVALCRTHDHENDAERGYTDECWLHMPDDDWSQGRGTVINTDRLWTDADGLPTSNVTIQCTFDVDDFIPK